MINEITFKKVTIDSVDAVQVLLDSVPTYYMKIEGVPRIEDAAKKTFEDLPPNQERIQG